MAARRSPSLDTRLVQTSHGAASSATEPLVTPIYQTAVYTFDDLDQLDEVSEGKIPGYIYTRYANPNSAQLEDTIAMAEGAPAGLACASGMAAILCSVLAVASPGDHIVATADLYGGTRTLFARDLARLGITTTFVNDDDVSAVKKAITTKTKILYLETLTNPLVRVARLKEMAHIAHEAGALLFVDNTFASPIITRPIEHGADVVVHSATKYINGHSDVTAGIVVGSLDLIGKTREIAKTMGPTLDPFAAWLTMRGLKTMSLRVRKSCSNALEIARFLETQPAVSKVYYPGLPSNSSYDLACKTMAGGFGGMLSFELRGGLLAAQHLFQSVNLCKFAPSLGDCTTLVTHPIKTSHRGLTPDEQAKTGITPGLVRLSVGIEDAADIIDDLCVALHE